MLDDLSKVEFTLLFGDVDEIIGDPMTINIPEQMKQKAKINNIKINDTIAEKYIFNKYWIEVDSYDGKTLNYLKHQILPLLGNIKVNEDSKKFKYEIVEFFKEQKIEYKIIELKSGEYVNLR